MSPLFAQHDPPFIAIRLILLSGFVGTFFLAGFRLFADNPILLILFSGFVGSFFLAGFRLLAGKSILPRYQPRRQVPWTGVDLLLIVLLYFSTAIAAQLLLQPLFPTSQQEKKRTEGSLQSNTVVESTPAEDRPPIESQKSLAQEHRLSNDKNKSLTQDKQFANDKKKVSSEHSLIQLLQEKTPSTLLIGILVCVIIAPIEEEIIFRLMFLGWLEKKERGWRRSFHKLFQLLPHGMISLLLTSGLFASLHFRTGSEQAPMIELLYLFSVGGATKIVVATSAILIVRCREGATWRDLGWDARFFWTDLIWGIVGFLAIALPILLCQMVLNYFLHPMLAPDPIPLFFFAWVLGLFYYRTHRLLPAIVMHMLLNATSLAVAWNNSF